ncbi:ferritin-like domain-containing protein [Marivita sp.]|uniref:ferritin-like domain-containing protein n=1 Tax=Marivita sp. TaxID=2003365 RepID=UPI0025BB3C58|nr:ferritin-like domain-containing protein [Marivita sp.]
MAKPPEPLNRAAILGPPYPQPVLGNPVSSLMESGVGNCYPGLEFDIRQLDVRFFPGLTFEFLGLEPAGPDGTQGVRLVNAEAESDPLFDDPAPWLKALKRQLNGPEGGALGDGDWYLHAVAQHGSRIELYDFNVFQNAVQMTPYEGETCWWIIRGVEADVDLTVELTQRAPSGQPLGNPVVLHGRRRHFLDDTGMIPDVYRAGELTASMCSPWTHDFRDCACQYWASNHPDVVLGEVVGPQAEDGNAAEDAAQPVTFLDWMRRRGPAQDIAAASTQERARPERYDPYEINLRWQELDFVLHGTETDGTPEMPPLTALHAAYPSLQDVITALTDDLAPLEFTLSMVYLYAFFSLRAPEDISEDERRDWPDLADDLRAARQLVLSVALSEMTHMRWVNQVLWTLDRAGLYPKGKYKPIVQPHSDASKTAAAESSDLEDRVLGLRPATPDAIADFIAVERPANRLDREYAGLVDHLRANADGYPAGLYELAVRIDSDGLQHYQKFRDVKLILSRYEHDTSIYLRDVKLADADDPAVADALGLLADIVDNTIKGYQAERADDMPRADACIQAARSAMRSFQVEAEALASGARKPGESVGVPFFAAWQGHGDGQ